MHKKIKTKEVIKLTDIISLNSLKLLENQLEIARRAQILVSRRQTNLKFELAKLEKKILSQKNEHNLLKSTQRNAYLAKNNNKKRDSVNYRGETNKYSEEIESLSKRLDSIKNDIECKKKKVSQLATSIKSTEIEYQKRVKAYQQLKSEFKRLTLNHTEWNEWSLRQNNRTNELAIYADIPRRHFNTVVVKPGNDKDKSLRLYYGDTERVYDDNDACYIILGNGSVYHRDKHGTLDLIKDKSAEQA